MELMKSKKEKDKKIIDYLDGLLANGFRRREAIRKTCQEFGILQPMTVYNTEIRVRKREWEARHGKREA